MAGIHTGDSKHRGCMCWLHGARPPLQLRELPSDIEDEWKFAPSFRATIITLLWSHRQIQWSPYLPNKLVNLIINKNICRTNIGVQAVPIPRHGTTDWFQIGKGVRQGCILSPCLFNLYAEYIMRNAGLGEAQAGIKIAGRNINNLRYAWHCTYGRKWRRLKSLLIKVKEESEKVGLKLSIEKTQIMASSPISSWQIDGETMETVTDFILGGLQNHCRWLLQPWN